MLRRTLVGIFRSQETTGEKAKDPALKTRHFKLSRDQAWDDVIAIIKKMRGYKILHEVKNVGEIVIVKQGMGRTQDITLTLFVISPVETAIDIYSASRGSLGDFGANYRTILALYKEIDKKFAPYKIT